MGDESLALEQETYGVCMCRQRSCIEHHIGRSEHGRDLKRTICIDSSIDTLLVGSDGITWL